MSIEVGSPTDGMIDRDDDNFQEADDGTSYNFRELMDMIAATPDIILTVPADQVELLKAGLVTRKSKDNAKLKASGMMPDSNVLAFLVYDYKNEAGEVEADKKCIRVALRPKKNVTILKIEVPSTEF